MDPRMVSVMMMAAYMISFIMVLHYYYSHCVKDKVHESLLTGKMWVNELLEGYPRISYDCLRMKTNCFKRFANEMRRRGFLKDSNNVNVEEQCAMFLFTLSHNERNRVIQHRFQHSGETISRYFHKVLIATMKLANIYIKPAKNETPEDIETNDDFYPYFKDCVGAIDGTHVPVWVSYCDQPRYRNRKGFLSQNVMAAVDFNMKFQYVYTGWEGSASDSKVLRDAYWRRSHNKLRIPHGKYYLVDAGYANTKGFLAPFRGVRYHLKEWVPGLEPQTPKELFNHRHSKLRNVVERTFGLLKNRFPILKVASSFKTQTHAKIVIACCVLHNYIREFSWEDDIFLEGAVEDEFDSDDESDSDDEDNELGVGPTEAEKNHMTRFRHQIANQMWSDFARR